MLAIIGVLLVVWLAFVVLGFVLKAAFWLVIVGAVLFVGTTAYGWIKSKTNKQIR